MKHLTPFLWLGFLLFAMASCKPAEDGFGASERELTVEEQEIVDKKWCAEKYLTYSVNRKILTLIKLEFLPSTLEVKTITLAPSVTPVQRNTLLECTFSDMEFIVACYDGTMFPVKVLSDQLVFPVIEEVSKFNECSKEQLAKF